MHIKSPFRYSVVYPLIQLLHPTLIILTNTNFRKYVTLQGTLIYKFTLSILGKIIIMWFTLLSYYLKYGDCISVSLEKVQKNYLETSHLISWLGCYSLTLILQ